jgi:uncharacterized protein YodC (DUF2158 family)
MSVKKIRAKIPRKFAVGDKVRSTIGGPLGLISAVHSGKRINVFWWKEGGASDCVTIREELFKKVEDGK